MAGNRVTSVDVARAAGVSQATVSRCFNNSEAVTPELRARIIAVANQLGYRRNALARSLVQGRSGNVAVVSGDLANPFYALALEGMTRRLREEGLGTLHFAPKGSGDVDEVLGQILEQQVDGVIINSITFNSSRFAEMIERRIPTVLFNRTVADQRVNFVASDSLGGGRLAATLLASAGHTRIGYIGGANAASTDVERYEGFVERLRELRIKRPVRAEGRFTYEGGHAAALELLSAPDAPDAIFCANDMMALGALDAARGELGLRVPDDVSIMGYGDVPVGAWPSYALTTIQPKLGELVDSAVRILVGLLKGRSTKITQLHIPGNVLIRKSVRNVETVRLP
jgi:DNA-binding LacI/PurR family transcriptional regulator